VARCARGDARTDTAGLHRTGLERANDVVTIIGNVPEAVACRIAFIVNLNLRTEKNAHVSVDVLRCKDAQPCVGRRQRLCRQALRGARQGDASHTT
jgi:hypothetical protein